MAVKKSNFQVDLKGVLKILSDSLYSSPHVFVRELIQNSVDAIAARQKIESFNPEIQLEYFEDENSPGGLVFRDNGIGLNEDEISQFLSKIGSSSKSGPNREDYIGQFGIGLLSCFMVADEIQVITVRTGNNSQTLIWRGKTDGTYFVEASKESHPVGTSVVLRFKKDIEFDSDILQTLLKQYGTFITLPISLYINQRKHKFVQKAFSWDAKGSITQSKAEAKEFFSEKIEHSFVLDLPEVGLRGRAFIIERPSQYGEKGSARVYIKKMLIKENLDDFLPPWAFFLRLAINSEGLSPTASREDVYENSFLKKSKKAVEHAIIAYLQEILNSGSEIFESILFNHQIALKALCLENKNFRKMIAPQFVCETSLGEMKIKDLLANKKQIYYVNNVQEFQRIVSVARANQFQIVNAGYIYESNLFELLSDDYPGHLIQAIDSNFFSHTFDEPDLEEEELYEEAVNQLQKVLITYNCRLSLKKFDPHTLNAIYLLSLNARKSRDMELISEETDDIWSFVSENVMGGNQGEMNAELILNLRNNVVLKLMNNYKKKSAVMILETILFNAMMQSDVPLSMIEQSQMNKNLNELLETLN